MCINWIQWCLLGFFIMFHFTYVQASVHVQLIADIEYPSIDESVKLECKHNVPFRDLHKVSFGREGLKKKFFEYFSGRNPPFVDTPVPGAILEKRKFSAGQVIINIRGFEATGKYYCEVATSAPYIYSIDSPSKEIVVVAKQKDPPKIFVSISNNRITGDELIANCSTSVSRPPPHISWMINGIQVGAEHINTVYLKALNYNITTHLSKSHEESNMLNVPMKSSGMSSKSSMDITKGESSATSNINHLGFERHHHNCEHDDNIERLRDDGNTENHDDHVLVKHMRTHRNCKKRHSPIKHRDDRLFPDEGRINEEELAEDSHRGHHENILDFASTHSELRIAVSKLHLEMNGKVEVTCTSTIPDVPVGIDHIYPDFKSSSIKIGFVIAAPAAIIVVPLLPPPLLPPIVRLRTVMIDEFSSSSDGVCTGDCVGVSLGSCSSKVIIFSWHVSTYRDSLQMTRKNYCMILKINK